MLNLVHFQMLHTSYSISSWLKCTCSFHSWEVIQNIYSSRGKAISCAMVIQFTLLDCNSLLLMDLFTSETPAMTFYVQITYKEIRGVYFVLNKFSAILCSLFCLAIDFIPKVWPLSSLYKSKMKIQKGLVVYQELSVAE